MARAKEEIPEFIPEEDELRARGSKRGGGGGQGRGLSVGSGLVVFITFLVSVIALGGVYMAWKEISFSQRVFVEQSQVLEALGEQVGVLQEDLKTLSARGDQNMTELNAVLLQLRELVTANQRELSRASASLPAFQEGFAKYAETLNQYQEITRDQRADLEQLKGQFDSLLRQVEGSGVQLAALRASVEDGGKANRGVETVRQEITQLGSDVRGLNDELTLSEKRIKANEEWLESINQWRRELNGRLLRLQELVESFGSGPQPDEEEQGIFSPEPL